MTTSSFKANDSVGVPALFLPHRSPSSGGKVEQILEVQAVDPPNPRSWFLGKDEVVDGQSDHTHYECAAHLAMRRWQTPYDDTNRSSVSSHTNISNSSIGASHFTLLFA
jgi:hypothetical protein